MYARVASFEQGDTSRVDELLATVSARAAAGPDIPECPARVHLTDRAAARCSDHTIGAPPRRPYARPTAFERMGRHEEVPEDLRGRRTSVKVYEVAIDETAAGAHAARVSVLEGASDSIDEESASSGGTSCPLSDISGWRGIIGSSMANGRCVDHHVLGQPGVARR